MKTAAFILWLWYVVFVPLFAQNQGKKPLKWLLFAALTGPIALWSLVGLVQLGFLREEREN